MAKDINLLPDITLNEEKESKRQKLLTITSLAILIVGAIALLGAFTIDITLGQVLKGLQTENDKLRETVRTYADVELMQRSIKAKLTASGNIIAEAKDYKADFENLQSVLPDSGISIQSIAIDKTRKVAVSGKANDSASFNNYIGNILNQEKGARFFDDINLGSVATAKDGTLQFTLSMNIKKVEEQQ